ncbi:MAG: basic secretory protein-like protein [Breznakibacter sp.]
MYKRFDFSLYQTPHFELYHYFTDSAVLRSVAADCEKWYHYHQQALTDTFKTRNPIIVYTNHADFQQTTAIMGSIDVGTGGVTEGMKRRVVFPMTFTRHETDHVLGHELVHAFQYHIITESENLNLNSISSMPLWMVEGMAEYLSIGPVSSHTALWMRDALIHRNFPSIEKLTRDPRYSPYRFGHAFWAWVASNYGEQYIGRLFRETAQQGIERSLGKVLGMSHDSLSKRWEYDLRKQLLTKSTDSIFSTIGIRLVSQMNGGRFNLSPSISPNGKYLIFLSERDVYGLDLFLADAHTGQVLGKIFTSTRYDEIDALALLDNAGTWSPDSKKFAYVGYVKGEACILIFDIDKNKIVKHIRISDIDAFASPAWSPDGHSIVFSGLKQGKSDIYLHNIQEKQTEKITDIPYSCIMPVWSQDGKTIWFTTDMPSPSQGKLNFPFANIASINADTKEVTVHRTFDGAKNINPATVNSGKEVLFLSDVDGRRNIYSLDVQTGLIRQMTQYPTGVCGMAEYSPSLTTAGDTLVYSMLWNGRFNIFKTTRSQLWSMSKEVEFKSMNLADARLMPYTSHTSFVESNLLFNEQPRPYPSDKYGSAKIEPKFKLDYIGNMSAGVMAGRFGAGMAGSIEAMFSDILGNHMLYSALSINGEIYDFGGQLAYLNQKRRIKKGASLSHIPYMSGTLYYSTDTAQNGTVTRHTNYLLRRTYEDKASLFAYYPLTKTRRVEMGVSYAIYNYRDEVIKDIYSYDQIYYGRSKKVGSPDGFNVGIIDLAYVTDNARYGLASPVDGRRMRIQFEQYALGLGMQTFLFDYRRYIFIRPSSLAFRVYHYGRYGRGSENNQLMNLFVGYPWYIRGYDSGSFYGDESQDKNKISINQLIGSKLLVANFEWRLPLTGPKEIAQIRSSALFSELAAFIDAGMAWDSGSRPTLKLSTQSIKDRIPLFSTGIAYRVNLMGAIVIEPYYAFPFLQKQVKEGHLGINLFAGW